MVASRLMTALRMCVGAGMVCALMAGAHDASAQGTTGSVRGVVRRAGSATPMEGVEVSIVGTRIGAMTRADGTYLITGAPVGAMKVRARLLGYAPIEHDVTVTAGAVATVDFALTTSAVKLDEVVVSGTAGQARRREVGNSIGQVKAEDTPEVKTDVSSMLQGRIAGVSIENSTGSTGAGSSIRLRGNTSVALSNQPLIYIDGVRVRSDEYPKNVPPAGSTLRSTNYYASPLNDINPEDIERIEVLKGAAATTLYGTEAAAGVVQIFTKRGSVGAASWNAETSQGFNRLQPFGLDDGGTCNKTTPCANYMFINPWLRDGQRQDYNLSVSGGVVNGPRYFLSGNYSENKGVLPLDASNKYVVRGNFSFAPIQRLTVDFNSGYTNDHITNTPSGNNAAGLTLNAFRRERNYFGNASIDSISQVLTYQLNTWINRMILGTTVNYNPIAGFTNKLTVGLDRANVENRNLRPFGFRESPTGTMSDQQWVNQTLTTDYVGTWEKDFRALRSTFAWGGQLTTNDTRDVQGYTIGFPGPGEPTVGSGAQWVASETRTKIKTGGLFLQELVGWGDRLFVTGGVRFDKYSAFGENIGLQTYPKISASYVISEEGFWKDGPLASIANTLKLRAAYGQAGRAPGAFDALQTYEPVGWGGNPAFRTRNVGNPDLAPERSAETEVGFESSSLDGRISLDFTYYRTVTSDALINVSPPPSTGFLRSQLQNVGTLEKHGIEIAANTQVIRTGPVTWDLGGTVALNRSKVLDLGGAPEFQIDHFGWAMEGQPLAVMRGRLIKNANAVDTAIIVSDYLFGPSMPTRVFGLTTSLRFPLGVELSARAEYQGGHYIEEDASYQALSRAVKWPTCFAAYDKQTRDGNQNQWTARERSICNSSKVRQDMFIQKADFAKLRDVTLRVPISSRYLRGTRGASVSASLINWFTWKNSEFPLFDPEMAGNDGFNATVRYISEQIPPPATFLARFQVMF